MSEPDNDPRPISARTAPFPAPTNAAEAAANALWQEMGHFLITEPDKWLMVATGYIEKMENQGYATVQASTRSIVRVTPLGEKPSQWIVSLVWPGGASDSSPRMVFGRDEDQRW